MKTIQESGYVDTAEAVIKRLKSRTNQRTGRPEPMVTTSKIRGLLSMSSDIYNNVLNQSDDQLTEEENGRIDYLRMRFVYESGRDPQVKSFVSEAKILDILKEVGGSRKNYILFNHYLEALVAFHKYYDGKD